MPTLPKLLLAALLVLPAALSAQDPTLPPSGQQPILTATGKGVQIYACQQVSGSPQWVFQAPEATLTNATGKTVATHGAGPIWKSTEDASTVRGQVIAKASPAASAVPWLLLKPAASTGSGIFSKVEYIRRSNTQGGNAPATGCDAQHLDITIRVPYTATYTFYSARL